ncbi:MAG: SDR family NAD(P)-dependent oxidoreductase [Actinobacteria bacterium]|nr:SDR family NAD(P)-dependent oxidoreductase [Actinomycetota bacterium]
MSLTSKRVLVTGAGGFIGSHLSERLVHEGAHVRALVHYNALGSRGWLDRSDLVDEMEVVAGDVTDRDSVVRAVGGVDIVFHLASLIAIPYSYRAPESYVRVNVGGALNVAQAARDADVERLVHTSTSEVYGTAQTVPITEAHPLQAQSPYAASKIGADKIVESFVRSFSLPAVTVRPFNTYGPRQSLRAVIPTIIAQCLAEKVVRLGNTSPTRDLNYVTDTVAGFIRAAEAPAAAIGQTFNLGTGREISVGDLALLVGRLCGTSAEVVFDDGRARVEGSEVERLLSDASRARDGLGWRPEVSLEDGLARTIDWFRQHGDVSRAGDFVV